MKLSKQSLMNALILATEKTASFMFAGAQNALQDGTLEIEGYVREDHFADTDKMVWTKFDPKNPKTYPPDEQDVIFINGESSSMGYVFRGTVYCDKGFTPIYWRPLPKPPTETEVVQ